MSGVRKLNVFFFIGSIFGLIFKQYAQGIQQLDANNLDDEFFK